MSLSSSKSEMISDWEYCKTGAKNSWLSFIQILLSFSYIYFMIISIIIAIIKYIIFFIVLRVSCKHKGSSLLESSLCMKNKNIFLYYSKNIKIKKLTLTKCYYLYRPYSNFSSCPNKIIFIAKERKNSGSGSYLGSYITFSYLVSLASFNLEQFLTLSPSFTTLPLL